MASSACSVIRSNSDYTIQDCTRRPIAETLDKRLVEDHGGTIPR